MVLTANTMKDKYTIFEEEFYPLSNALYNFAYSFTLNDADAADLVQEAYLKAFNSIATYEVGTNPKAWLFTILRNSFINKYRKAKKQPNKVDFDEVLNIQDASYDLRTELFGNMMGDEVTNAVNSLPMEYRTVIVLCDLEDFKYDEIAEITGIPIGTVRSRLFRGRNMLKKLLKGYAESKGFEDKR